MRKTYILTALAAVILSASCQKEKPLCQDEGADLVFTATIASGDTKTVISGTKISWELYDKVVITDASSTSADYEVRYIDEKSGKATFVKKADQPTLGDGPYTATYGSAPSTMQSHNAPLRLPMSAYSETTELQFRASCGIMNINVPAQEDGKSIIAIYVVTDDNDPNTYGLDINVVLSRDYTFSIAVPSGHYTTIRLIMGGIGAELKPETPVEVKANAITTVDIKSELSFMPVYRTGYGDDDYVGIGISCAGYTWAPVNCGYSPSARRGLFYQWAKRHGFATTGDIEKEKKQVDNMSDGIHCTSFLYGKRCWFKNNDTYDSWPQDKDYDPCPEGWQVPNSSQLGKFCTISKKECEDVTIEGKKGYVGLLFTDGDGNELFLPVAGYRDHNDADLCRDVDCLRYWSSTHGITCDAACTLMRDKKIEMYNGTDRSTGMLVRCVKK